MAALFGCFSFVVKGYMNAIGAYAAALKMTTGDSDVLFGNIKDLHSLNRYSCVALL